MFTTEHDGPFGYRYRRLLVERLGRRSSVREFVFACDLDARGRIASDPRRLVRQRGRSLDLAEAEWLWEEVERLRPQLQSLYLCPDDMDAAELDPARSGDGVPVAVHLGEEGPACLALREGRAQDQPDLRRVLVARYPRDPAPFPAEPAPLRELISLLDPGLRESRAFSHRRTRVADDLCQEFQRLKAKDFLNLRRFELRALEALAWLGDPAGVATLAGELFAPDADVRMLVLDALAELAPDEVRRDVELLCHDDDPRVRERAQAALRRSVGC
ncbi:MAG: HEAT repeat domain-containing protein [Planctomycetota bacterium]